MSELLKLKVGFADIEEFSLGLNNKFRSKDFQEKVKNGEMNESKVIKSAMEIKMRDEQKYNIELNEERNKMRNLIGETYTQKFEVI